VSKKIRKKLGNATRASVAREMAKPRMTRSAKIAELKLDITRIQEPSSVTVPAKVNKIIPSPSSKKPEKAQISLDGADRGYRDFRIENSLTDEHGDDVKLKKGAHVEVIVAAEPEK
jgi:hypothetical protein